MSGPVLTVVSSTVDPAQEASLAAAYQVVLDADLPDGVIASALLRGDGNQWQIATLWRDRAALDAMRALMRDRPDLPAAPRVFREIGAESALAVFDVINGLHRQGERDGSP
jgi:hypothetical protein